MFCGNKSMPGTAHESAFVRCENLCFLFFSLSLSGSHEVADDMDQDECDETIGSDIDDRASETDSKKDGSRGTSRGSSNEGKSQGNSSKPRRYVTA